MQIKILDCNDVVISMVEDDFLLPESCAIKDVGVMVMVDNFIKDLNGKVNYSIEMATLITVEEKGVPFRKDHVVDEVDDRSVHDRRKI